MKIDRNILYKGVLGLAIGDALGVPVEFICRDNLKVKPVTSMISGGYHDVSEGTWSDDTSMVLATVDALNKFKWNCDNENVYHEIMKNFTKWLREGQFACDENVFDVGLTCQRAIQNYEKTKDIVTCGCGLGKCGNGALMRILPAVFLKNSEILKISRLTHNNPECDVTSLLYCEIAKNIIEGLSKHEAVAYTNTHDFFTRIHHDNFKDLEEENINSSGYCIDTIEAAVWCFLNTDSYEECVLKAVNLGYDTDTVGAVAGGLAGLYYGIGGKQGIPDKYINKLRELDKIKEICFSHIN